MKAGNDLERFSKVDASVFRGRWKEKLKNICGVPFSQLPLRNIPLLGLLLACYLANASAEIAWVPYHEQGNYFFDPSLACDREIELTYSNVDYFPLSVGPHVPYPRNPENVYACMCWPTENHLGSIMCSYAMKIDVPISPKNHGGQCGSPDLFKGNPINIAIGNKYQRETDYHANGVFSLNVSRSYNSATNSWQIFPEIKEIIEGVVVNVVRADGKGLRFSSVLGVWVTDTDIVGTLTATEDASGNITSWTYTTRNDQIETYDAQGRILSVTDRSGLSHTYTYQSDSITVTHTRGDTIVYHLDGAGRVIGFTDPDNKSYQYSYDIEDRIVSVTYPDDTPADTTDNPQRIYHYENSNFPHALTGITDENGNRYATWSYDEEGRAISSEHANGVDKTTLTYKADGTTAVTNPLGKQTTYHFTTIHGVRKVAQVEGHPTASCEGANKAYSYDANGNIASKTDWNGVTTNYTYDMDRNLELTRTEAAGTPQERTITTEWHTVFRLPTKIAEPEKVTEYTYDAQGRVLFGNMHSQ